MISSISNGVKIPVHCTGADCTWQGNLGAFYDCETVCKYNIINSHLSI